MSDPREVVFAERSEPGDYYRRSVRTTSDGGLEILGHDLGEGPEAHFGWNEYEFVRTVPPEGVARLRIELRIGDQPLLPALRRRFDTTYALESWLDDHDIATTFWNRVGT